MRIIACLALAALAACASPAGGASNFTTSSSTIVISPDETAIRAILYAQQASWNSGDIDGFMQGYWRSPDLRFGSGGGVTRGWDETLARYKTRYADRAAMGELTFSNLEIDLVSEDAAVVHGAWALQRESDAPSGLFTLVFKEIDGGWYIVSDTTTSAD
ncbi:MAG: nuclear transport factor 2 family protein [Pseudomonadota bacterium]